MKYQSSKQSDVTIGTQIYLTGQVNISIHLNDLVKYDLIREQKSLKIVKDVTKEILR